MNSAFLEKYHHELKLFRDASKEFAKEHPSIAGHLGLLAPEIEDPYIERLIEAVSFLTARINHKIDEQYPQFLKHIFKVIQPSFVKVIPSCAVVALNSYEQKPTFIPKNTLITTHAKKQGASVCQFSTCHDIQITPLTIKKTSYNRVARGNVGQELYRAILNISIDIPIYLDINKVNFEELNFYIQSTDYYTATELLYHLKNKSKSIQIKCGEYKTNLPTNIDIRGIDFDLDLCNDRKINYLKNITEYSILPEKYLFFRIKNLKNIISDCIEYLKKHHNKNLKIELIITFDDFSDNLEKYLKDNFLSLSSVLITNAFLKKTRFVINHNVNEQHIVMDKVRSKDFEVISIQKVEGFDAANTRIKSFEPIYKIDNYNDIDTRNDSGFYSEEYKPNYLASTNNSYKGNECFLTIRKQYQYIRNIDLNQLSVEAWCSNRALVRDISWTLDEDLTMDDKFKISKITRQCRFTEPLDSPINTVQLWRLMNLIASNFVINELKDSKHLTNQIKDSLLTIYELSKNEGFRSQVDSIISIKAHLVSQNFKKNHKLTPINGIHFDIVIDESLMTHAHPYIWGLILLSYLKGFSPINKYIKLIIYNKKNEIIAEYNTLGQ